MGSKISQILEGWRNKVIPPKELAEIINKVSKERLDICKVCEHNSKNSTGSSIRPDVHCTECGCTLSAKTKCLSCECPLKKWVAIKELNKK